jgi:DNA polymerase delta subunit 3
MADDFKNYLATEVLSERRSISYRNVARALKVHANSAKCMLFDFYNFQNGKKPGSVYATYLLSGIKKRPTVTVTANGHTNGIKEDYNIEDHMNSSPPPFTSSMLEQSQQSSQAEQEVTDAPVKTITLVREEALEDMKAQYESISSMQIYSLSPGRIQDLVTLTDIGRGLFTDVFVKEDPLQHNKTYGVIQNPNVRRRKGKRPLIPSGPASKFQAVKDEPKKTAPAAQPTTKSAAPTTSKSEEQSRPSSRDSTSTTTSTTKPTLKRDASDLFRAFAKQGQSKKPTTPAQSQSQSQDTKMTDADDEEGESEDEALFLDNNTRKPATKKRPSDAKKERDDKAAKLRKMMESDDEDEPAVPNVEKAAGIDPEHDEPPAAKSETDANLPSKDRNAAEDEVAWSASDSESKKDAAPPESTGPTRRRGKRKVMKKKTMKDEDGYLVTKEEAVWESFSEDEAEPLKASGTTKNAFGSLKGASQSQKSSAGTGGSKKKGGGGNIMSFFGKK